MTRKTLHDHDILDLLDDGNTSDIESIDKDEGIFSSQEFDQLMECFDNDEDIWNEVLESLETSNSLVQNNVSNEKKLRIGTQPT